MKHRRFALILALAMLLSTALFAMADTPVTEVELEGIGLLQDWDGEDLLLDSDGLDLEGGLLIPDEGLDRDLLLDGPLELQLTEDDLIQGTEAPGRESDGLTASAADTTKRLTSAKGLDGDTLLEAWMRQRLPGGGLRANASARSGRASLDGINQRLYDALVPMIREVAEGRRTATRMKVDDAAAGLADSWWTAEQLGLASLDDSSLGSKLLNAEGFNQKKIMQALLADCPYDLYWFDKVTGGMGWSFNKVIKDGRARLTGMTANIAVVAAYSRTGAAGAYEVNDLPARVNDAVTTINAIVADNRGKGDLDKLRAYANAICGLTAYNNDAAGNPNTPYGDPWQLVYVFDGDDGTRVVCEGYSKAFKYLCDLSDFSGEVYCELMGGEIPAGTHMWNAVRMPDGRCYPVDLTNSDGGDACNERVFLKGSSDRSDSGFTCGSLKYTYNANTLATFSAAWRSLSAEDYGKGYAVTVSAEHGTLAADPQVADAGQAVTLTLKPDPGYAADGVGVSFGGGRLDVQPLGDGQWRFAMPWGNVTATARPTCTYAVQGYEGEYDGQPHGITVTMASGSVSYGTASGTYDLGQSPTWKDAGAYTVYYRVESEGVLTGAATVNIAPRAATLAWTNTDLTYNGEAQAPAATVDNLVPGDSCSVTVTGGRRDAGSYTATATGLSNGNYVLAGTATRAFTIAPKAVALSWSEDSFTYDGSVHLPAATVTGLVSGDSCAVTLTGGRRDAGSYTATATGLSNGNYALAGEVTRAFTIAPKPVEVSWSDTGFTYDGNAHLPTATATGLVSGDSCSVAVTGGRRDAGGYTVTATGLSNGNYALAGNVTRAFTIVPRAVKLIWSDTRFTYDGSVHLPVATATGLVSGDSCSVAVTGAQRDAGSYTATATGLSNGNYALPQNVSQAFVIKPRTVGLKWSRTSLVYNGKAQKPTATATGLVDGDRCVVTVKGSRKNAGSYTAKATGLSNGNYALPKVRTKTCTIRKKTIRLKWTGTRLKYNGNYQKPTAAAVGLIEGDKCIVRVSGAKKKRGAYIATAYKLSNPNYQLPAKVTARFRIS